MTTKHKAEVLACRLEDEIEADVVGPAGDEYARITGPSWKIIGDSAALLRTIPALEAEIERLKAENKALIDVITRVEVKPACNATSTSIRGN